MVKDMNLQYLSSLSYIGSSDDIAPNSLFANFVRNMGGSSNAQNTVSSRDE